MGSPKRAGLPRAADFSRQFLKDWRRLNRSGRFDMKGLKTVMVQLISNDQPLPAACRDHSLSGDWQDFRECHIGGDFLLIYRIKKSGKHEHIIFVRAGTHAELFE